MNQLISKTRLRFILFTVLVLVFLIPLVSFAQESTANEATMIQRLLYTIVNSAFGWMVWASGLLLNYSVEEYVVKFGFNFKDAKFIS